MTDFGKFYDEGVIRKWIDCSCSENAHAICITADLRDDQDLLFEISMRLRQWRPWYHRVWIGLTYAFGVDTCSYGEYDGMLLDIDDAVELREILTKYIDAHKNK